MKIQSRTNIVILIFISWAPFQEMIDLSDSLKHILFHHGEKYWDAYTRALLYSAHNKIWNHKSSDLCLDVLCFKHHTQTEFFPDLVKKVSGLRRFVSKICLEGQVHSWKYNRGEGLEIIPGRKYSSKYFNTELVVNFAGMLFFLSHKSLDPYHAPNLFRFGYFFPNMYNFNLQKYLRMNLTVLNIYISSSIADNCALASLRIIQVSFFPHFEFCGVHSLFSLFSRVSQLSVILLTEYFSTQYDVRLLFSVIDSEKIFTVNKPNNSKHNAEIISFCIKRNHLLHKYHLSGYKFQQIFVKADLISIIHFEVFDGPGTLSQPMQNVSTKKEGYILFSASTFQCTLFVLVDYFCCTNRINFTSVRPQQSMTHCYVTPTNGSLYEFKNVGLTSWVIVNVSTAQGLKIEGAWENIMHSGVERYGTKCKFAGASLYEFVEGRTIETFTKCRTMFFSNDDFKQCHWDCSKNLFAQHRNFYTKSNDALLVIYSFRGYYSHFSGVLRLKTTLCKSISLDICDQRESTLGQFFPKSNQVIYGCVVIQMYLVSRKTMYNNLYGCKMALWLTKETLQLSVEIKAWLKSFYPNYQHHKMLISALLQRRNAECKFCWTQGSLQHMYCLPN